MTAQAEQDEHKPDRRSVQILVLPHDSKGGVLTLPTTIKEIEDRASETSP